MFLLEDQEIKETKILLFLVQVSNPHPGSWYAVSNRLSHDLIQEEHLMIAFGYDCLIKLLSF